MDVDGLRFTRESKVTFKLIWDAFHNHKGHPGATFQHSDAYCMIFPYPNNTASVRHERDAHECPGWGLCVAAVNRVIYSGCFTYTTIGIFMICVVMAINS